MKEKLSRQEIQNKINELFSSNPSSSEIKKVKKLAMSKNIKLGNLRKKFCKKCYNLFNSNNSETRIRNNKKIIKCKECGFISRYNIK